MFMNTHWSIGWLMDEHYLQIFDGNTLDNVDYDLGYHSRYCGSVVPERMESHQATVRIDFKTDSRVSGPGFRVAYTALTSGKGFPCLTDVMAYRRRFDK